LENEKASFHNEVYEGYKKLIGYFPEIKIINAERSIDEIFCDIREIIDSL
jgi:dTMP kinase